MLSHISQALRKNGVSLFNPALKEGLMGSKPVRHLSQNIASQSTHHQGSSGSSKGREITNAECVGIVAGGVIGGALAICGGFSEKPLYPRDLKFEKDHKIQHAMLQVCNSMFLAIPLVPVGAGIGWFLGWTFPYTGPVGAVAVAIAGARTLLEEKEDVKNQ